MNHSKHDVKDAKDFPRTEKVKALIDVNGLIIQGLQDYIARFRNNSDTLS